MATSKTALVLAGGGMFGAYQAGVWKTLVPHFRPDLIVGASIGAINGWAMAGGCPPDEWIHQWLHLEAAQKHRWRFPWPWHRGIVDAALFEDFVQSVHGRYQPIIPFAAAITAMPALKACCVQSPNITWQHLAASCAVPGIMPQYRIDGTWYSDGGLLGAMPIWAATLLGATRLVCVNILPKAAGWLKPIQASLRLVSRHQATSRAADIEVIWIEHATALGPTLDSVYWSREKAERMIDHGQRDAEAALPSLAGWQRKPEQFA